MTKPYEGMNVMQKLAKARLYFLNSKIGKSGKNIALEFKYFELEDIVPTAIRIFDRVGLLAVDDLTGEYVSKTIYNVDNPLEMPVRFSIRNQEVDQIVTKTGKTVTNPLQALGSSITYLRRYLWMVVMDITEPDNVDEKIGTEEFLPEQPVKAAPKPPATKEERAEVKKELTEEVNKDATPEQLDQLKTLCRTLLNVDPDKQEEFINKIAMQTSGFTEIPADACDQLCGHLIEMLKEYGVYDE